MTEKYKILYKGGEGTIVEKKSRFIASTQPVESEEEALAFIERLKKKYWDASHNCYAYVIGDRQELQRCNDDGEPGQTAGRPMLDVLLGGGVCNACIVVTRYFGGTLLGTGGLVRAYSRAAQEGLSQSVIVEKQLGKQLEITTDYNGAGKIQYTIAQAGVQTLDSQYTDKVVITVLAPIGMKDKLRADLTEAVNGRCRIEEIKNTYYGTAGKDVVMFD